VRTSSIDSAKHWLRLAIAEHTGGEIATIEAFNDKQETYEGVKAVLNRAKQLASAQLPAPLPMPVALASPVALAAPVTPVEVIPPVRLASPSWEEPEPYAWADHDIDAIPEPHEEPPKHDPKPSLRHKLADWWD